MFKRPVKLITLLLFLTCPIRSQDFGETRALWVTRWDYKTPADIKRIVENAAALQFNTLLFQVRGDGTVGYPSKIEPWTDELGGRDPGWNPLQLAIEFAHAHHLQLHAWINVYPAWMGSKPPVRSEQLYHAHSDWLMIDEFGHPQKLNRHYTWLSPTNPEVSPYLRQICEEIYANYDVDGMHLDYIRYPSAAYSYDPPSLEAFFREFKKMPQDNPLLWADWRRKAINCFVENLYEEMKSVKPQLVLSASVMGDYDLGARVHLQDSHEWLARGAIDAIYPMLYIRDDTLFSRLLGGHRENDHNRHIYPGIYAGDEEHLRRQIQITREAGCKGMAIFSYDMLCPNHLMDEYFAAVLQELWREPAVVAAMPWKAYRGDTQGPVIEQVYTLPNTIYSDSEFRIAAKINDPSGVYDDPTGSAGKGVYLAYSRNWPSTMTSEIKMSPMKKMAGWFITDEAVPSQKSGLDFRFRIFAWDDYHESAGHPKRNLGFSDVWALSVLARDQSFICKGPFGPVIEGTTCLEVDGQGQIWIGTEDSGLVVLDAGGTPRPFSPVETGWTRSITQSGLSPVTSLAYAPPGILYVHSSRSPRTIYRIITRTGAALQGVELDFDASALDCDAAGRLYVLEDGSTRWHVMTGLGTELAGGPFGIDHTGNDLTVLADGSRVFVSDRTTGGVQCWHGAVEGFRARYWREADLPALNTGSGRLARDSSDYVYVPHEPRGVISIFSRSGRLLHHLSGGRPPLYAPMALSPSITADSLYTMENSAGGPARLSLWVHKNNPEPQSIH